MGLFGIVLLVLFAIVCALLVFLVIIQDQEGEGLGGIFAGAGNAAFGSRSANVVVKTTYVLGTLFFVLAFSLALINRSDSG
ncbi:MAG TPA: preprotein translocase subunit SecG, partial [Spirochaetales bacterium]|nr:preprotein translocase subunit SecG [Spirochaetales bacterium]